MHKNFLPGGHPQRSGVLLRSLRIHLVCMAGAFMTKRPTHSGTGVWWWKCECGVEVINTHEPVHVLRLLPCVACVACVRY